MRRFQEPGSRLQCYVTVELDPSHRRGLPCSDMNLATARCVVRERTTTCR